MNKTQLQQKIVDMEKQLAELKKELEKKDKGIWKPKYGDSFCFLDSDAEIIADAYCMNRADEDKVAFGNYYKTKEEAEKMANYLKYTNLLRKYVEEHSEPLDWNTNTDKHFIYCDTLSKRIYINFTENRKQVGQIYASSKEILEEAIKFVGESNIKKYIFGIEE